MTSTLSAVVVDCRDPETLARFWCAALGYVVHAEAEGFVGIVPAEGGGPHLDFVVVPEPRTAKNRLHLDLRPREGSRDEEVARVRALGATEVADRRGQHGPGSGWVVFADPEGNEFCILRSRAEVDA